MRLASQLRSAIKKLIKAEEADSFKGMGDPDEYAAIELRLKRATIRVEHLLEKVDQLEPKLEEVPEFVKEFNELSHSDQQLALTGKRPEPRD